MGFSTQSVRSFYEAETEQVKKLRELFDIGGAGDKATVSEDPEAQTPGGDAAGKADTEKKESQRPGSEEGESDDDEASAEESEESE